jgi:hypothetical protein
MFAERPIARPFPSRGRWSTAFISLPRWSKGSAPDGRLAVVISDATDLGGRSVNSKICERRVLLFDFRATLPEASELNGLASASDIRGARS